MFSILFGLTQFFIGVYGLASVLKMKQRGDFSGGFLPRNAAAATCTNSADALRLLVPQQALFVAFCLLSGVLNILDGQYGILSGGAELTLALFFLLIGIRFSTVIRKVLKTYFPQL